MTQTIFSKNPFTGTTKKIATKRLLIQVINCLLFTGISLYTQAQDVAASGSNDAKSTTLFMDIHQLEAGKVTAADVAAAHQKDLAAQNRFGVKFLKYWVDEKNGVIYCLSSASDAASIRKTHAASHGLMPGKIYPVVSGTPTTEEGEGDYFLDIHELGKVTAADVEKAHEKDLKVQRQHGVHFIDYWVNEETGLVFCLSKAKQAGDVTAAHKEAHGLLPATIIKVTQGE